MAYNQQHQQYPYYRQPTNQHQQQQQYPPQQPFPSHHSAPSPQQQYMNYDGRQQSHIPSSSTYPHQSNNHYPQPQPRVQVVIPQRQSHSSYHPQQTPQPQSYQNPYHIQPQIQTHQYHRIQQPSHNQYNPQFPHEQQFPVNAYHQHVPHIQPQQRQNIPNPTPAPPPFRQSQPQPHSERLPQPQHRPQNKPQQQLTVDLSGISPPDSRFPPVQMQNNQRPRVLQDTQTNIQRVQAESQTIKVQAREQVAEPEQLDYPAFLLSLADEYLDAAQTQPLNSETSHKLVATALGCMEAVLMSFSLPPLKEAQVTMKHAQVLYDQTNNVDDAEKMLTKAIDICDRNRYIDLRYSLQLLLSRVLHVSKPKAAKKDIQTMVEEAETYHHLAWEYALRFHLAFVTITAGMPQDIRSAISQFEKLGNLARKNGDHAVLAVAATLEALLHLQTNHSDAITSSQQALAKARALQLNNEVAQNPQLIITAEFIDLCCSLCASDILQYENKRKIMQQVLYTALEDFEWHDDGSSMVALSKRSVGGVQLQEGGLILEKGGVFYLTLTWMKKTEAEALGYLLSAVSTAHKMATDGGKSERFIDAGLDIVRTALNSTFKGKPEPAQITLRKLELCFLLELVFLKCGRGQWQAAMEIHQEIEKVYEATNTLRPDMDLKLSILYLKGIIQQGTGDVGTALSIFRSSKFSLERLQQSTGSSTPMTPLTALHSSRGPKQERDSDTKRKLSILANMNVAMILHPSTHPAEREHLSTLLSTLNPIIQQSNSKPLQATYSFLVAVQKDNTILKAKSFLGSSLTAAKQIADAQITALVLVVMQEKFFRGVVGEQAVKCARAASHQAARWGDPLWTCIATGMEAECYEIQGMNPEAERKRGEAMNVTRELPNKIRSKIFQHE